MIRLTFLLRRKAGMSLDEFHGYLLNEHGPLLARHAHHLAMTRCVLVRTLAEGNTLLGGTRGPMEPPYDGVTEIWWDSLAALAAAAAPSTGRDALDEIAAGEKKFVDLPSSPLWFGYEYPQVNPAPENVLAKERSSIRKFYYPLRHLAELSLDEAQLYWRTQHGPVIRSQATASGVLRYVQVHRFETPLEAAWRQQRGTLTEPYTGHAELWFDSNNTSAVPSVGGGRLPRARRRTNATSSTSRDLRCGSRRSMYWWIANDQSAIP